MSVEFEELLKARENPSEEAQSKYGLMFLSGKFVAILGNIAGTCLLLTYLLIYFYLNCLGVVRA